MTRVLYQSCLRRDVRIDTQHTVGNDELGFVIEDQHETEVVRQGIHLRTVGNLIFVWIIEYIINSGDRIDNLGDRGGF